MKQFNYVIVGSGIAGLTFALKAAERGSVAIITKRSKADSNTAWAQGGIACVTSNEDSVELHVRDTLIAGDGLCNEEVVRTILQEGPACVEELVSFGMHFDQRTNEQGDHELDLGKEGGHSKRRILHARDRTGFEIEKTLLAAVIEHPNITLLENHMAVDLITIERLTSGSEEKENQIKRFHSKLAYDDEVLGASGAQSQNTSQPGGSGIDCRQAARQGEPSGSERVNVQEVLEDTSPGAPQQCTAEVEFRMKSRCVGLYVFNEKNDRVETIRTDVTVLATGGCGKVYLYTTNPDIATGDGIAIAWRAGAAIANMEFMQFHPTCLYHPKAKSFLISEAVRGEGGILLNSAGERFMERYDQRLELAPRDVVARAIDAEMKKRGNECVFLDISHKPASFVKARFPKIYETCCLHGIDITKEPIPVVPAAHYQCGGIKTDLHGRSSLPGLYAIGETACTGLHGANRLASNSLLEALVMAHRAEADTRVQHYQQLSLTLPEWNAGEAQDLDEGVVIHHNWDEIRRLMWDYMGIVRTDKRLQRAATRLKNLTMEIQEFYWNFKISADLLELRNLVTTATLMVHSAMSRKESRGLHYTLDYPEHHEQFCQQTVTTNVFADVGSHSKP
jgi:L-aspartate oxidase